MPGMENMNTRWVAGDGSIVRIYEDGVPEFAWSLIGALYGSLYSSRAWLHHHGEDKGTGAAVLDRDDAVAAILLFRHHAVASMSSTKACHCEAPISPPSPNAFSRCPMPPCHFPACHPAGVGAFRAAATACILQ